MLKENLGFLPFGENAKQSAQDHKKSATAYRTISEVASDLGVATHVLRFWESKFPQIKPLKRAGGRRYYRPGDIVVLKLIQELLYKEGYTIRGVQTYLKKMNKKELQQEASSRQKLDLGAMIQELESIRALLS